MDANLFCPLSHRLMENPVILNGVTYDRESIKQWLQQHNTCPLSGETLMDRSLTPNHSLRIAILNNLSKHGGGCFSPDTEIIDFHNHSIPIHEVKMGMILKYGFKVKCVIRFRVHGAYICRIPKEDKFGVTPFHPLRLPNEKWFFPHTKYEFSFLEHIEEVYNLILETGHFVETCSLGIQCITLGHNMTKGIEKHPYFGTKKVIMDMERKFGFDKGLVVFAHDSFIRNSETGLIENIQ